MSNEELLNRYASVAMELQEEYLKCSRDFVKETELQKEFSALKKEVLGRMEGKGRWKR